MSDWFYLSFADGSLPKGQQFLGGCYVKVPEDPATLLLADLKARELRGSLDEPVEREAVLLAAAISESQRLGINPGGEVQSIGPIPEQVMDENVPTHLRERLLTREELEH